jgi:hypothetical protein
MKFWSEHILQFYRSLDDFPEHNGIQILYPYDLQEVSRVMQNFYRNFYNDDYKRTMILGINPGRLGAGITGLPFIDPIRLENSLGIINPFKKTRELSSVFIYDVVDAMGGAKSFYERYYISSVSPLGFVRDGKNLNYYDDEQLYLRIRSWMIKKMKIQLSWPINRDRVILLGKGKNYKHFKDLNKENRFFNHIEVLPHPRWVMQYRLREKDYWVKRYSEALGNR